MERISLSAFVGSLAVRLPQRPCGCEQKKSGEEHVTFSAEYLPEPPPSLFTADLVIRKSEHHYGNNCRIDVVHFYASGRTYRELAVLILAALFSNSPQRVGIVLEHEASDIKYLELNWKGYTSGYAWDYRNKPAQFTYHPEIPERVPWRNFRLDERDMPVFDVDFCQIGRHHPVNDLNKRDKVEIDGNDNALVLLAELLLNIGLPACDLEQAEGAIPPDKTYILECSLGHHRVGNWSAEAQFHLPHSFSWPGDYPTLNP